MQTKMPYGMQDAFFVLLFCHRAGSRQYYRKHLHVALCVHSICYEVSLSLTIRAAYPVAAFYRFVMGKT